MSIFQFKKEVGWSEVLALGALIVSGLALYYTVNSDNGFIIQGGGPAHIAVLNEQNCALALSIPVEFHNSGKKALTLEQLAPVDAVSTLLFNGNNEALSEDSIQYSIYQNNSSIGQVPSLWLQQLKSFPEFAPSYGHINDLIQPSESYNFYFIILIEPYTQLLEFTSFSVLFAVNANFSNGQNLPVRSHIELSEYLEKSCDL